jgi:hypothetical protein
LPGFIDVCSCLLCRFALYFGGQKDICVKEEILLFDHGKVRASSDRAKTQAAAEAAACGFGVVHGDEIAADIYEHV